MAKITISSSNVVRVPDADEPPSGSPAAPPADGRRNAGPIAPESIEELARQRFEAGIRQGLSAEPWKLFKTWTPDADQEAADFLNYVTFQIKHRELDEVPLGIRERAALLVAIDEIKLAFQALQKAEEYRKKGE